MNNEIIRIAPERRRCEYKFFDYENWRKGLFHLWRPNGDALIETSDGFMVSIKHDHIKFTDIYNKTGMRKFLSCDQIDENRIWVSQDVYERLLTNPDNVYFEAVGQAPIMWSGRKGEEK